MRPSTPERAAAPARGQEPRDQIRFGSFELDRRSGELRRSGLRLRIQEKPLRALLVLTDRPGTLVTRQELIDALWPDDHYGDFEHGLNLAINRLRSTLRDRADHPRIVETVPRRGYRLIAPVDRVATRRSASLLDEEGETQDAEPEVSPPLGRIWNRRRVGVLLGGVLVVLVLIALGLRPDPAPPEARGRVCLLVLPFRDLSPEPADFLSQGLTADLIASLGRLDAEHLGVIALTTALRYEGETRSISEIARELGVQYVVDGSVTRSRDEIRVHVQLVDAMDQTQLVSESYDRQLSDLLDLERQVTNRVTASLASEILGLESSPLRVESTDPEAHLAFLRGRFLLNQRTDASLRQAVAELDRAIEIHPTFAMAHALRAQTLALFPTFGLAMPSDAMPEARASAQRALELDADLAEAHAALALVRWSYDWDFAGARDGFRRAIKLNANYAPAHQWYANCLTSMGELAAARHEMHRALELDPLSLIINTGVALVEFYARDYDGAIRSCRTTLELQPYFAYGQELLALALAQNGDYRGAIAELESLLSGMPTPAFQTSLAQIHALAGHREEALEPLEALLEGAAASGHYVPPYRVALVYSALGEDDQAFRWLDKALADKAFELTLLEVDPRLDPIRDDPRFERLLGAVGLAGAR